MLKRFQRWLGALFISTMTGCVNAQDLDALITVMQFEPSPLSGVKPDDLRMYLIAPVSPFDDAMSSQIKGLAPADPDFLDFVKRHCNPDRHAEPDVTRYALFAGPELIVAAGQWLYNTAVSELDGRLKRLQDRSSAEYYFQRSFRQGTPSWNNISCIVIHRGAAAQGKEKRQSSGMTAVISRRDMGAHSDTLKLIYARLDNAVALTGAGTAENPPSVQVDIAFSVQAATKGKERPEIYQVTLQAFKPFNAELGKNAKVCGDAASSDAVRCMWESDLLPKPSKGVTSYSISVVVKETGSGASKAAKARAGLEAMNALVKPKFEAWLKEVAQKSD
ncbi:MAG: hypothetical protein ACM31O_17270 [Bacteroidota bacterium]